LASADQYSIQILRDGAAIAMQLIVEHASRLWIYKVGYDEEWAEHSPGLQLMWEVMRHACLSRMRGVNAIVADATLALTQKLQRPMRR